MLVQFALCDALEVLDVGWLEDLRKFFLRPTDNYSIVELTGLLNLSADDLIQIFDDVLDDGKLDAEFAGVPHQSVFEAIFGFYVVRWMEIEQAPAAASLAIPARYKTMPMIIHLPQVAVDALSARAVMPSAMSLSKRVEATVLELLVSERLMEAPARQEFSPQSRKRGRRRRA
jgi:hypothetical protein